ncbi:LLM class F420-dependent oxidoreductase [Phycicoccus duodecadis]|uniref:F420-dependent oxidoreductase-like protein n=1 Tax=Phycicoccus duodecadis TaxID=173053 RepID=A0A2N3YEQ4_9MICO|nr:LLM class F420-dependent oxidoreductase [Phycicoccus duodecadis]PKW25328.1 F420-dependent oxidoreductase-like protein [Phycicoccus duodecadis]
MKLGLQVSRFAWTGAPATTGATWRRIAQNADRAGLASLWVMDHLFQISMMGPPEDDMLEGYTALAHAAAVTEQIELGTLVTGVTYRHPGVLLKTVTTLDVLSGGRAWLGIGAAWYEEEHRGLGIPYPSTRDRFELLEDTLQLAHRMFADDDRAFQGRQVSLERPLNHPQPVRRPPIMVGGGGERKTLRLVAQYADACNLFDTGLGPEGIPHKLEVLRGHCDAVGRDYGDISKTCLAALTLDTGASLPDGVRPHTVDQAVERLGRLAEAGIDHVILSSANPTDEAVYPLLAEVVRQVA